MSQEHSKRGSADTFKLQNVSYPDMGRSSEAEVNALKMNKIHYYLIYDVVY